VIYCGQQLTRGQPANGLAPPPKPPHAEHHPAQPWREGSDINSATEFAQVMVW